jgi:hypothetical protein
VCTRRKGGTRSPYETRRRRAAARRAPAGGRLTA